MKSQKKLSVVLSAVAAIVAAALMAVIKFVAPVCSGLIETVAGKQIPMKCHWTAIAVFVIAALIAVVAIAGIVTEQFTLSGITIFVLATAIFVLVSDSMGIGVCANPEMACHTTAAYAKTCAIADGVVGIVLSVKGSKTKY